LLLGLGGAAFLYWRSQQAQAAALAAAQAAPGPGLVQRAENTAKVVFSPQTWRAVTSAANVPGQAVAAPIASGAASVVHSVSGFVKGLL